MIACSFTKVIPLFFSFLITTFEKFLKNSLLYIFLEFSFSCCSEIAFTSSPLTITKIAVAIIPNITQTKFIQQSLKKGEIMPSLLDITTHVTFENTPLGSPMKRSYRLYECFSSW